MFDELQYRLTHSKQTRRKAKDSRLDRAIEHWGFRAELSSPPAARIAALLDHAARRHPKIALPFSTIAMLVFGLPYEPRSTSNQYVRAVTDEMPAVRRRLERDHKRVLLRLGGRVRCAVDHADARAAWVPRLRREAGKFVSTLRGCMRGTSTEVSPSVAKLLLSLDVHLIVDPADRAWLTAMQSALRESRP